MRKILLVGAVGLTAAGCSHTDGPPGRAVLDQGISIGSLEQVHVVGPQEARRAARSSRAYFLREIKVAARKEPAKRFDSPPRSELLAKLRGEAAEHHFRIVAVRMAEPDQFAPMVIVSTTRYGSLARAGSQLLVAQRQGPRPL
jgi:hypothetical protein